MPLPIIVGVGAVVAAIIGTVAVAACWREACQVIAAWLRESGRSESWLMDAVVLLDNLGSSVRRVVQAKGKTDGTRFSHVRTDYLSLSEIDDEDVRRQLARREHVNKSVMTLM